MPRKYKPTVKRDNPYGDFEYWNLSATMKESKDGEWVKLETFQHETSRLIACIKRLKAENETLRNPGTI